jgi:PAS domain S-box-containing protein
VLDGDLVLFNQTQAIELLIDPASGRIVEGNPAACSFYGYSSDQMRDMPLSRINAMNPDERAEAIESARSLQKTRFRFRHQLASGAERDVDVLSGPIELNGRTLLLSTVVDVTETLDAQRALAEAAEQLRVLFETSADGVVLMNDEGRLVRVNARYAEMLGYAVDELVGKFVGDVDAHETTEGVIGRLALYRASDYQRFERQHRARDGRLIDLEISLSYVRASESFIIFARDLTARKADERRMAELHELNEKMIAGLPVGVLAYRVDGQCVIANPSAEALIGAASETLLAQNFRELESWRRSGLLEQARKTIETGTELTRETHIVTTFGLERWLQTTTVMFASRGEPHLLVLLLDVTEQRKAEEALRESLDLFQNAMEHAINGMALVAPDGRWLRANPSLCDLTGYTEDELQEMHLWQIVHPEEAAAVEADFRGLGDAKAPNVPIERRCMTRNGIEIPVLISDSLLVRDDSGRPLYAVVGFQDVSEQKHTEAVLRRSIGELEQFAYVVSHDLRAPLRAIRNLVGWIAEDLGGESSLPQIVVKNIDLLRQRTDRLDALIEGILQYSRIGREVRETSELNPAQLIRDTWVLLGPTRRMSLRVDCTVPWLQASEVPLSLVIRNLMDNAIKHNDAPEGIVTVTVRAEEQWYRFDVADNGPGIPAEHRDRIFRIFETLQPKDATGTVGVGLALVRKTVDQIGGRIEVLDNPDGRGALFRVRWPKG